MDKEILQSEEFINVEKRRKIKEGFAELFVLMFNQKLDNIELMFDLHACYAKFKVDLIDIYTKKGLKNG